MTLALARAGLFTGATALCETGVFLSSTVIIAFVAIEAMPSHIIVFRAVAVTYVIGTGFAQAVTIQIARRLAMADAMAERGLRRAAILGMGALASIFLGLMLVLPAAVPLLASTRPVFPCSMGDRSLQPRPVGRSLRHSESPRRRRDSVLHQLRRLLGVGFGLMACSPGHWDWARWGSGLRWQRVRRPAQPACGSIWRRESAQIGMVNLITSYGGSHLKVRHEEPLHLSFASRRRSIFTYHSADFAALPQGKLALTGCTMTEDVLDGCPVERSVILIPAVFVSTALDAEDLPGSPETPFVAGAVRCLRSSSVTIRVIARPPALTTPRGEAF
jgi:hypothetical protein